MPRSLLTRPFGPRTDVRYMTRRELFRSAAWFLRAGCLLALLFGVAYVTGVTRDASASQPLVHGVAFALAVLTGMAFAAALYLDIRGALRSTHFNPAMVWHLDHVARGGERLAIELHDSEIVRAVREGEDLVLHLQAYVHHSAGTPGRDAGTGWIHAAEFRFRDARTATLPQDPSGIVGDGVLRVGELELANLVPLPVPAEGPVRFEAELTNGGTLEIEARAVLVQLLGDGECLEIVCD